jgi:hypothetical protein
MQVKLCVTRGYQRLRGDMTLFLTGLFGQVMVSLRIYLRISYSCLRPGHFLRAPATKSFC